MKAFCRSGELFVWLTASAVAMSLLMVGGLLVLIIVHGLGQFWPQSIEELRLQDGRVVIGQIVGRETIPGTETAAQPEGQSRIRLRIGNRDAFGHDFTWVDEADIAARATPDEILKVERREWGPALGRLAAVHVGTEVYRDSEYLHSTVPQLLTQAQKVRQKIDAIEHGEIAAINHELEGLRLKRRSAALDGTITAREQQADAQWQTRITELDEAYQRQTTTLDRLYEDLARTRLGLKLADDTETEIPLGHVVSLSRPNTMGVGEKLWAYLAHLWHFLSSEPREANTEGGIFPAIFGTVLMVFLMTIVVMPFGIMAAVYLREYAHQGPLVRMVRIAVNNLAGVPSIVFGVFGLGCFVYAAGGTIDRLFFPESLPNPTFGTGGIFWASLTLALLTVPVVIVATEEGLSSVPREFREGSIGLGATKFETLWHVILPCALPGILTGLILAMARAAGEVAPLMLTGVVKLAPSLPLDGAFPFVHLDRKFMHLGFHIYDVGFQSPNVEAAKPMVYMTTLTLIVVVVTLNLTAVMVRNRLRKRFAASAV